MNYRKLGHSDSLVSRLIFGAEPLGGTDWGNYAVSDVVSAVRYAYDNGVTAFDTADVYGLGLSETRLAQALGHRRHEAFLMTKFGVRWEASTDGNRARTYKDMSPTYMIQALEASLKRLDIESIPLYFVHYPDQTTPTEAMMEALGRCQKEGKIQHIGLSNFSASQVEEAHQIVSVNAVQLHYNRIVRDPEQTMFPLCQKLGISVFAYGPLAQGLLTGKFTRESVFAQNDRRHRLPHFQPTAWDRNEQVLSELTHEAQIYGQTLAQTSLRWILDNPQITSVIIGAKSTQQVQDNLGVLDK